ncbi:MAG: putative toxin-antitoxin system toxin component, PIN family [Planctomycetia bacterium]|nr:putative toxin-antitoxin system toxin component, PIN family [Planctomycetia bacterium]
MRKKRTAVTLDTNVLLRNVLTTNPRSPNAQVCQLWFTQKKLQLIVSQEVIAEYLEIFERVGKFQPDRIVRWQAIFEEDPRCTLVNLAKRYTESRDPDDNVFLATAFAGRAEYLITNDRDLLDLSEEFRKTLSFEILTPRRFLQVWQAE